MHTAAFRKTIAWVCVWQSEATPKALMTVNKMKWVLGCMREANFPTPPLARFNHLVRGAKTLACTALRGGTKQMPSAILQLQNLMGLV